MRTTTIIAPLRSANPGRARTRAAGMFAVGSGGVTAIAFLFFAMAVLVVGLLSLPVRLVRAVFRR